MCWDSDTNFKCIFNKELEVFFRKGCLGELSQF